MNITVANVKLVNNETSLKGTADLEFDKEFVVKGIRIMEGKENMLFVSMPSSKVGETYRQDCFPITAECRQRLNQTILGAYEQKLEQSKEQKNDGNSQTKNHNQASGQSSPNADIQKEIKKAN